LEPRKYRPLDIRKLMKKRLTYSVITAGATVAFLALLLFLSNLLRPLPPQTGIPAIVIMVIVFAYLLNRVKSALDESADKHYYGKRYLHRKMLLDFADKTSTFMNLEELANELLGPLVKVIKVRHADLLLPLNGQYSTKFAARLTEAEPTVSLTLTRSSLVLRWLENKGTLLRSSIENNPDFDNLSTEERSAIDRSKYELMCPILSRRKLVGILALGPKQSGGLFTGDEIDLMATLSKESAAVLENTQIYAQAKENNVTDELTGLLNHRSFQECFNQEIEKAAHSRGNFSLLILDLDFFKTYNDIYGHKMGDDILREIGQLIRNSIRGTDIGGRYGGDEFAIVLLHTPAEGASTVAERIRHRLQSAMEQRGIMLTCSIGIACWRVDGVTRETLIQAADKALCAAKSAGRNRVSLASKLEAAEPAGPEPALKADDNNAIENIVHALAATVDTRDHYTFGHSKTMSRYATELAAAIGYTKEGIKKIRAAALLHDIGKLSIPDSILSKNGPLTDAEWEIIKRHPEMGVGILKYIVGLRGCVDAVLYHHERYDGKGYPKGLKGNDIPLDARILTIADSFEAMTSERGYKERRLTEEEAIQELIKNAGTQFDPKLVEVFIALRQKAASLIVGLEKD
jgi:diguanylate cyclase (GGDEF)-like protein/putative nucleotidyltransferase with HDIG domain